MYFFLLGQKKITELFIEEHECDSWDDFKKSNGFKSDRWLQVAIGSLKNSEHPYSKNAKIPAPVLSAYEQEKREALQRSASSNISEGVVIPYNEKKMLTLHTGGMKTASQLLLAKKYGVH